MDSYGSFISPAALSTRILMLSVTSNAGAKAHPAAPEYFPMMDVLVLAIGFVCFALSIGYVYACDRL
jgi:hypothetical protein